MAILDISIWLYMMEFINSHHKEEKHENTAKWQEQSPPGFSLLCLFVVIYLEHVHIYDRNGKEQWKSNKA